MPVISNPPRATPESAYTPGAEGGNDIDPGIVSLILLPIFMIISDRMETLSKP